MAAGCGLMLMVCRIRWRSRQMRQMRQNETAWKNKVFTWTLPPPMTQKRYNLSCFLVGDDAIFKVKIDHQDEVGNLINKIRKAQPTLADIRPSSITLYMAEIDTPLDTMGRINELKRRSQNLSECRKLGNIEAKLSTIFGDNSQGKYTIVQIPEGESIFWCRR